MGSPMSVTSAVICEKFGIIEHVTDYGMILEFRIAWPPGWGSLPTSVSQRKSHIAKTELQVGHYYAFTGFLNFNKVRKYFQFELYDWHELARVKTNQFKGQVRNNKPPEAPQYVRQPKQDDMMH